MPVVHEESLDTTVSPAQAFALCDDLPRTKEWLPPCVSLTKDGAGPNAVGDRLDYRYRQGGGEGRMDGTIVARVPGERLCCRYEDAAFDVEVDLRVAPAGAGARLTHRIAITPKRLVGRLLAPLILLGLRRQTRAALDNLRRLLEAPR